MGWFDELQIEAAPQGRTLSDRVSVAQKEHECYICPKPIQKGEKYQRLVQVTDGVFEVIKLHAGRNCAVDEEY